MPFLLRCPANCAWAFNLAVKIFLAHLVLIGSDVWVGLWKSQGPLSEAFQFVVIITIGILGLCMVILQIFLAYQIGYHPVLAVLWGAAFFIPMFNFIVFLLLWVQIKKFLIAQGYRIVLMGAKLRAVPT